MTVLNNIKTFDELLDVKYGKIGSPKRDQFHEDAKKFIIEEKGNIFHLEPEMPLYQDMEEILQRKKAGKIELYSEEEVWND